MWFFWNQRLQISVLSGLLVLILIYVGLIDSFLTQVPISAIARFDDSTSTPSTSNLTSTPSPQRPPCIWLSGDEYPFVLEKWARHLDHTTFAAPVSCSIFLDHLYLTVVEADFTQARNVCLTHTFERITSISWHLSKPLASQRDCLLVSFVNPESSKSRTLWQHIWWLLWALMASIGARRSSILLLFRRPTTNTTQTKWYLRTGL